MITPSTSKSASLLKRNLARVNHLTSWVLGEHVAGKEQKVARCAPDEEKEKRQIPTLMYTILL